MFHGVNAVLFLLLAHWGGASISHEEFSGEKIPMYRGDLEELERAGLIAFVGTKREAFDITSKGFEYYRQMKQQHDQPLNQVESKIRDYLVTDEFQQKYPQAYRKWIDAESLLWDMEAEQKLTTIGHMCREAIQEFAEILVQRYQPLDIDEDKAHTVKRIKAVLKSLENQLGRTVKPFLDALLAYWGAMSDLIQRQEHGGQKEGEPLRWEDGRRVVFHTVLVMYEIDRSLSLISPKKP